MDERLLIEKCLKGKRSAQRELYSKFSTKFFGLLIRYIGSKEEAEIVLQNAFINLFNSLHKFDFSESFEKWAKKFMVDIAIEYMRKKKEFHVSFSSVSDSTGLQDNIDDCECLCEVPAVELMEIIKRLTPGFRFVFNMHAIEEYTHKEISEKLNISEDVSKFNYTQAKEMIKTLAYEKYRN